MLDPLTTMFTRIRTQGGSLILTIPSHFARALGLHPGDVTILSLGIEPEIIVKKAQITPCKKVQTADEYGPANNSHLTDGADHGTDDRRPLLHV